MKKFVLSTFLVILTLSATSIQAGFDDQYPPLTSDSSKSYSPAVHPIHSEDILKAHEKDELQFEQKTKRRIEILQSNIATFSLQKDNARNTQESVEEALSTLKSFSQNPQFFTTQESLSTVFYDTRIFN